MYAIVQLGHSQYKICQGDMIAINRLKYEKGKSFTLDKVLLFADGKDIRIGQPFLKNVKITAKVVDHPRGNKVIAFKYRRRKNSAVKKGHRQDLTALNITKITAEQASSTPSTPSKEKTAAPRGK